MCSSGTKRQQSVPPIRVRLRRGWPRRRMQRLRGSPLQQQPGTDGSEVGWHAKRSGYNDVLMRRLLVN